MLSQKIKFWVDTHQEHQFFWILKKKKKLKFSWKTAGFTTDIDRKMKFFSNPKLSIYYMCHMCANHFYDSESSTEWYRLKKLNFESIHIRHINFFEFWKNLIFRSISRCKSQRNLKEISIFFFQNWKKLVCLMCIDSKLHFFKQY